MSGRCLHVLARRLRGVRAGRAISATMAFVVMLTSGCMYRSSSAKHPRAVVPHSAAHIAALLAAKHRTAADTALLATLLEARITARIDAREPRAQEDIGHLRSLRRERARDLAHLAARVGIAWQLRSIDPRERAAGAKAAAKLPMPGAAVTASESQRIEFLTWAWHQNAKRFVVDALAADPRLMQSPDAIELTNAAIAWWPQMQPAASTRTFVDSAVARVDGESGPAADSAGNENETTSPAALQTPTKVGTACEAEQTLWSVTGLRAPQTCTAQNQASRAPLHLDVDLIAWVALDPIDGHRTAAWVAAISRDLQAARRHIESAAKQSQSERVAWEAALIVAASGDERAAFLYATAAARHAGEAAAPFLDLAELHVRMGQRTAAMQALRWGLPLSSPALRGRADALLTAAKKLPQEARMHAEASAFVLPVTSPLVDLLVSAHRQWAK